MLRKLFLPFLLACTVTSLRAVELTKLVVESQRLVQDGQQIVLVWWIPTEFWEASLEKNPNMTEAQRKQFIQVVDEYLIFAVSHLDVGPFGGLTPKSRAMILENTTLTVDGRNLPPLSDSEVSRDAANFMKMMKPMMNQMLGQLGQGMEFVLYPNARTDEKRISAQRAANMQFAVFDRNFDWKLPLPCLLPPKIDPTTKQEFPGDFRYNPYTGNKLVDK